MTPIERFARWWVEERGMKCEYCGVRKSSRADRFCTDEHEFLFQQEHAI